MKFNPEIESGNIEYKLKIIPKDNDRLEELSSQLKWRLFEGNGIAKYYIGIGDDGKIIGINNNDYQLSINNLNKMCKIIDVNIKNIIDNIYNDKKYYIITIVQNNNILSFRTIFIGPSNSGKSTIIGNFIKNINDDGNGRSRKFVFNHKHEIYSGETSSVSIQTKIIKKNNICYNLNLIDTPGNKKYMKTILTSINKYNPNLIFLVIDPLNIKINELKLYLDIIKFHKISFKIILTKMDLYENYHKNYLLKNILNICNKEFDDENIKKIPFIEINNLNKNGYNKILNTMLKLKNNFVNHNNISIQICDILNIPNFKKIYTGFTYEKVNINDEIKLISPSINKNIKFNSIYFMDNPIEDIDKNNLITFTLNDNDFDNKSDLILTKNDIIKKKEIFIISEKEILNNQGICIFNNQYNLVKIIKIDNTKYKLINTDNSYFINLSGKIIIKTNDLFFFTHLINI